MALYKYQSVLALSADAAFDKQFSPGEVTPHSGIYTCVVCGREVVSETTDPLPPQNHHQHPYFKPIVWRLIVYSDGREKRQ